MSKYQHIFFDLDNTLWDFDKSSILAFEKIYDILKFAPDYFLADFLPTFAKASPKISPNEAPAFDDYIDEGISEEEAVEKLGSIDEIVSSIASEIPLTKIAKKKFKSRRRLNTLEIVLLIVGSPIWISLFAAFLAVIISLYAALWSIVISLWAIVVSCFACSFASLILFIINL